MLSKVISAAVLGVNAHRIEVEVDIVSKGLPHFSIVGLPDTAVKESKDRVRAALKNIGFSFPLKQITINLAPADIKKEGAAFDLPIAIGILASEGVIASKELNDYILIGELSLDGGLRPVRGTLPMAIAARDTGLAGIILPYDNGEEAAVVSGISVYRMRNIGDIINFFKDEEKPEPLVVDIKTLMDKNSVYEEDFNEVKGQEHVKRALEVAVAGAHNILMIGPPGSGKTMLARRIPSIMPMMSFHEAIETTKILSVAGLTRNGSSLSARRPFRSPHHTISDVAMIGGGQTPKPGEVSLAHNGVLFLDELPEFKRNVLEVLRQPLEDNEVTVSRTAATLTYPAAFMLIASMNPCPCGFLGDDKHNCTCSAFQVQRYRSRISGPLLDRMDIQIEVPAVPYKDLSSDYCGERSEIIRSKVISARERQVDRFKNNKIYANGQMSAALIKKHCSLSADAQGLIDIAMERLNLSARAYTRILKVSRTIADIDGSENIKPAHISEAIQYRSLDRGVN
ncbi:MAG: YifB family Mg chelatase-like AAA ATPase [Nitrospirae bacterium]|nr:YifB family Mg chelatase-like AAA ATPase [Nitrospirota bacterium]MBF0539877.1 YifB family Mg chelatase-like AAA ATPase [Nitrospirota bacterium]